MATKMLTPEEWNAAVAPFWHLNVKNPAWSKVHSDMIVKWVEAHIGGWFYYDGENTYVFGSQGDYMLFRMWIADDPFKNDDGEILVQ